MLRSLKRHLSGSYNKNSISICEGKGRPRTSHVGPEGALDGGGWSTPRPGRFTPVNDPVRVV
jgi:hypothetical protein